MKVYKFFKIPNDDDNDTDLECKYILYAITNNKEYAERFKKDRNMKKFICKKHKNISKEEYAEMCNEERGSVLDVYKLTTILGNNRTMKNSDERYVLMTYWEKQLIEEPNSILDDELFWQKMPYPLVFKKKYQKLLKDIQYTNYYQIMTSSFLPIALMEKLANETEDFDYSAPSVLYDEVALFIDIIKDTL